MKRGSVAVECWGGDGMVGCDKRRCVGYVGGSEDSEEDVHG